MSIGLTLHHVHISQAFFVQKTHHLCVIVLVISIYLLKGHTVIEVLPYFDLNLEETSEVSLGGGQKKGGGMHSRSDSFSFHSLIFTLPSLQPEESLLLQYNIETAHLF